MKSKAQVEYDAVGHEDLGNWRRAGLEATVDARGRAVPNRRGVIEITLRSEDELQWLTAVNDARLVIGTVLGVTEDDDTDYARADPRFDYGVLYGWLPQLHFELLALLPAEIGWPGSAHGP